MRSTVVFGRCRLESDPTLTLEKIRALALRYYPPSAEEVEAEIARDIRGAQLYVIEIEHLTGKQIKEKQQKRRLVQITHPEALECVKRTRRRINQATSARMRCKRTGLVPHAARDDAARTGHGVGTGARGNKT